MRARVSNVLSNHPIICLDLSRLNPHTEGQNGQNGSLSTSFRMLQTEIITEWMMIYATAGVVHFWWWNVNNKVKKSWIFVLAVSRGLLFRWSKNRRLWSLHWYFLTNSISGREKSFPVSIVRMVNGVIIDQCITLTNTTAISKDIFPRVSPFLIENP